MNRCGLNHKGAKVPDSWPRDGLYNWKEKHDRIKSLKWWQLPNLEIAQDTKKSDPRIKVVVYDLN
jgi:hypothetical protein